MDYKSNFSSGYNSGSAAYSMKENYAKDNISYNKAKPYENSSSFSGYDSSSGDYLGLCAGR